MGGTGVRLTLGEVATAIGGDVLAGDPGAEVTSVSIDSRSIVPGALFVALRGERDGHDYLPDAFARGAAAALVREPVSGLPEGAGLVVVSDTAAGLTALGGYARERLEGLPVVGITGSTGKTSTKDLTAAALSARFSVCASPSSFNNEIGLPLTLLSATEDTTAVVAEMGSRGIGHIAELCAVARPRLGVITNIGIAHTEFFGSRTEVAKAKGELLEALPPEGHAVLSADDDCTPGLARRSPAPVLRIGLDASADVVVSGVALDPELRSSFRLDTPWGRVEVGALPVRGAHQALNAAFAVAVAGLLGVPLEEASAGLADAAGAPWRMELRRTPGGLVVLNDAYNANPASMAAALEALASLNGPPGVRGVPEMTGVRGVPEMRGQRFAVLGHMAELGACSDEEHRRVGRLAAACGLAAVVAVGPEAAALAQGVREAGAEAVLVEGPEAVLAALAPRLRRGDAVLVKASRVVGLERVAAALARWEPAS